MTLPVNVATIVQESLVELNRTLPRKEQLQTADAAPLMGGGIDSLGLINLLVMVEQRVEDAFHVELGISSDGIGGDAAALATVGSFTATIVGLLEKKIGA